MAPDDLPRISVVVPTYRRAARLPALLDALDAQSLDPDLFEVIVVDDCSDDDTARVVQDAATRFPLRLLRTARNSGPAVARNLGWTGASAPLVAFTDDDCLPAPGWLEAGMEALESRPSVGVVQGRTLAPPGVDVWGLTDWYLWRIVTAEGPEFEGCNVFYRAGALRESRGFDEEIGWWGEDSALGWSVLERGWERHFAADALVYHEVARRGWRWFLRNGLRETNVVLLGARFPGYRKEAYWRPWAYRREDAAFLLAAISGLMALRWRPAVIAALPYLWWRRPSMRQPHFARLCLQVPIVDAARCFGQLRGAIKYRVLVI